MSTVKAFKKICGTLGPLPVLAHKIYDRTDTTSTSNTIRYAALLASLSTNEDDSDNEPLSQPEETLQMQG